jgi:sporulation integral membrane protein YtvI
MIKKILRGCWVLLICLIIIYALYWITPLIYPFILAWLIAYFLNPIVNLLQHGARMPRWLAVTLSIFVFVGAMLTVVSAVITRIIIEIFNLSQTLEGSIHDLKNMLMNLLGNENLNRFVTQISSLYQNNRNVQDTINNNMNHTAQTITDALSNFISMLLNSVLIILSSLPNIATILIVVLLAVFFISKDWVELIQWVKQWLPVHVQQPISLIWVDLQKALFGYLRAQFIVISLTAVLVIIGLLILDVEYAITIGLLIGILDLLPYMGVGIAMIPWIAYSFMSGDQAQGIGLSILYGIILIARQIIEPKVLATSVGLQPLPTLIAMFVGLQLFGILGMIIGPATLVLASAIQRANVLRDVWNYIFRGGRHT